MKLVVENTPPKINNKYEGLYLSWRDERLKNISRYKNQIETDIKLLRIKGDAKILDVGCAFGFSLTEIANLKGNYQQHLIKESYKWHLIRKLITSDSIREDVPTK